MTNKNLQMHSEMSAASMVQDYYITRKYLNGNGKPLTKVNSSDFISLSLSKLYHPPTE